MKSPRSTRAGRTQEIGDYGENRVVELLSQKGFTVEKMPKNFPFFDLMAKQGRRRLLEQISLGLNREDSQRFVNERGCRG